MNKDPQTHKEVLAMVLEAWEKSINAGKMERDTVRSLRRAWRCGPPEWKPALERIAQLHDVNLSKSDVIEMRDRLMDGLRDTLSSSVLREPIGIIYKDLDTLVESGSCSAADAMRLGVLLGKLEDRVALGVNGKAVKMADLEDKAFKRESRGE